MIGILLVGLVAFLVVVGLAAFFAFVVPWQKPTWDELEWVYDETWVMAVFVPVAAMVGCLIGVVAADMPPPSQPMTTEQIESLLPPGWRLVDPLAPTTQLIVEYEPQLLHPAVETTVQEPPLLDHSESKEVFLWTQDGREVRYYGPIPDGFFEEQPWWADMMFATGLEMSQSAGIDLHDYKTRMTNPGVTAAVFYSLWNTGLKVVEAL